MKIHLPKGVRPVPELFQEAGYYTAITGWPNKPRDSKGKTDYNFEWDQAMYDGPDWSQRKPGQPFFAQVQLPGGKHRGKDLEGFRKVSKNVHSIFGDNVDPNNVSLPPYYLDDPTRAKEELYDLKNDPFEINNLASDPKYKTRLEGMAKRLDSWIKRTKDQGDESEAMYESDMAEYRNSKNVDSEQGAIIERNIALMKKWAAEGK